MDFEKLCWENFRRTGNINLYRLYSAVVDKEKDERNNNKSNSDEDNSI